MAEAEEVAGRRNGRPDDLAEILKLAEELRASCEMLNERIQRRRQTVLGLVCAAAGVCIGLAAVFVGSRPVYSTSSLNAVAMAGVGIITSFGAFVSASILSYERSIRFMRKRLSSDSRAFHQLVRIMRETEKALTESKEWSPLERARFHIQLSRFEIGDTETPQSPMPID